MVSIIQNTLMISSFVFGMMLLIEYLSVLTRGRWQQKLHKNRWEQYIVCAFLGVVPGCLGAFTVVAMYSHRIVTLGAVVATMIATSGDDSYYMLAKTPVVALGIFAGMFFIGIVAGALTDKIFPGHNLKREIAHMDFEIHPAQDKPIFALRNIANYWKNPSPARGVMTVGLALIALGIGLGFIGEADDAGWGWERISIFVTALVALLIVATVPDHFLDEHLWKHVVLKHLPQIFLWTLGVITALYLLHQYVDVKEFVLENPWAAWAALGAACVVGIIPQSGPHLAFLALYLTGAVPFSVLLTSSIVQDGHGMLPLLAHSRRDFIVVKAVNLVIGLAVGLLVFALGR
ncbi:MAG: arsenic efflux protein [Phycisphaerae bacterium]|nr:arsenic efflux protein [Phycisphaerae bacterium]